MIAASIIRGGTFSAESFNEVASSQFKIKKGTNAGIIETNEIIEDASATVDFSIKSNGSIVAKQFVEK